MQVSRCLQKEHPLRAEARPSPCLFQLAPAHSLKVQPSPSVKRGCTSESVSRKTPHKQRRSGDRNGKSHLVLPTAIINPPVFILIHRLYYSWVTFFFFLNIFFPALARTEKANGWASIELLSLAKVKPPLFITQLCDFPWEYSITGWIWQYINCSPYFFHIHVILSHILCWLSYVCPLSSS